MESWRKKLVGIIILVLVLVAVLWAFGGLPMLNNRKDADSELLPPVALYTKNLGNGMKAYMSPILRFMVAYPESFVFREYNSGSASIIAFEDANESRGFQIYVIPYKEEKISKEQFLKDIPTGVMNNPVNIEIDGIPATAFYSTDGVLGETYEIWFINNGFLYEINTYKDQDAWLNGLMEKWKFL